VASCVVIGGNGFLGSELVDALVLAGHEVAAFDRFSLDTPLWTSPGVERITGDFLDRSDLRAAITGRDYVFHFLSTTTPATSSADPTLDVRTNVAQSVELFALAAELRVRHLYFASTGGAMYGDAGPGLLSEETLPAPLSPYAIGKLALEGYLRYFQKTQALESTSFRISNPYGPRQHANKQQGVIPIFLDRIARGLPLTLLGDGAAVRDFVYAPDAVRMIAAAVGRPTRHAVYNIGSGEGVSIARIVELAREVTGMPVELEHREQPATFVDRVVLDIARYVAEFGAPDLLPLRDGIELTWRSIAGASR
jgi:UDP-glucose 4-epimerase